MTWLWSPSPGTTWLLWWPYSTNTHNLVCGSVPDDHGSGHMSHINLSATWDCSPSWKRCLINVVDTFQYLGSTVFDDCITDSKITHRITKASQAQPVSEPCVMLPEEDKGKDHAEYLISVILTTFVYDLESAKWPTCSAYPLCYSNIDFAYLDTLSAWMVTAFASAHYLSKKMRREVRGNYAGNGRGQEDEAAYTPQNNTKRNHTRWDRPTLHTLRAYRMCRVLLEKAMGKLKNGKSAGDDQIVADRDEHRFHSAQDVSC